MGNDHEIGGCAIAALRGGGALLAPMSGITDAGFRRIAARFGASLVVSEMVASRALVHGAAEALLRAEGAGVSPHVVQLAGCEAWWLAEAARVAEASGAAVVDINMGCPAKHVMGGLAGSGLMRDLDHATTLIEVVVAAVAVPVTLKMRLGWDHASVNAPELARRAEQAGVALVTVHGRTRQQFYKGRADWSAVRAVRHATTLPLVVNGDIGCIGDARVALAVAQADAVMIGRASLGRPWLIGQVAAALAGRPVPEPTRDEKRDAFAEHYDYLLTSHGKRAGLRHARKHVLAYAEAILSGPLSGALRARLGKSEDPAEVIAAIANLGDEPALREAA